MSLLTFDRHDGDISTIPRMKLKSAVIKNFRSIKEVTIQFSPRCRILVGMNESGKTNILKALALLDPKSKTTPSDVREPGPDEDIDQAAIIRFVFELDPEEIKEAISAASSQILGNIQQGDDLSRNGKAHTLRSFFESKSEALHTIDLRTQKRTTQVWGNQDWTATKKWKKPRPGATSQISIAGNPPKTAPLTQFKLVDSIAYSKYSAELEDVSVSYIGELIGAHITSLAGKSFPDVVFWEYKESNLLPGEVEITSFAEDPNSCEPLRNMFELAGYFDVKKAIGDATNRPNGMRNLLDRVSTRASKHINEVWKEMRGMQIDLRHQGSYIETGVRDAHNVYSFDRRSDGFKRFVTFLLLISARSRTEYLYDALYLQDEPDTSLHPSGARFLRDELIKISERNYVVFSTHSTFMIDKERIDRHIIVQRKNEVTSVSDASRSNFTDEEVILNAIGTSIFEGLAKQNIIFEGWRDKRMFQVACQSATAAHKDTMKNWQKWGHCFADGAKDISAVSSIVEIANRGALILSDGDDPAKERQKHYRGLFRWFRYDELVPGTTTSEDFVKEEHFLDCLKEELQASNVEVPFPPLTDIAPRMTQVETFLHHNGIQRAVSREFQHRLKNRIVEKLKPKFLAERYFEMFSELARRLTEERDAR